MGQQRIRRKRRRGFRKPDAIIVTLASMTVILLLVWGGLHWKESSERALIVSANGIEQGGQAPLEEGGLQTTDSEGLNGGMDEQPSATVETVIPVQQAEDKPDATGEESQTPEASEPAQESVTKPDIQTPAKSESPSTTETNPPINQEKIYEQEIIQLQTSCTKDMKMVLTRAESSAQQLDRADSVAIQAWKEKLTKELTAAESRCDGNIQEVLQNAENDSISTKVIEDWKQTYSALKEKLREESSAKLQKLIVG